jgi:hypothetical protein
MTTIINTITNTITNTINFKMSELTYISTVKITNYANVSDLKVIILKTLARWFPNSYVFNEGAVEYWIEKEGTDVDVLYSDSFQFELSVTDENIYELEMYAIGRLRRQGSSCDFFEMILECLEFQIKHPERDFDSIIDCHKEDDDEEEEQADEEEHIMNMPLRNMNDLQIEKYVERIGRCPRDECDEWTMVYNGGDILRYSYCNFIQWHIEDQIVSNITITRAIFNEITFTNYVFDNVTFDECVFKDIILNNTTFKNSKFIECELDSSMVPDKSCEIINNFDSDDDDHIHNRYY